MRSEISASFSPSVWPIFPLSCTLTTKHATRAMACVEQIGRSRYQVNVGMLTRWTIRTCRLGGTCTGTQDSLGCCGTDSNRRSGKNRRTSCRAAFIYSSSSFLSTEGIFSTAVQLGIRLLTFNDNPIRPRSGVERRFTAGLLNALRGGPHMCAATAPGARHQAPGSVGATCQPKLLLFSRKLDTHFWSHPRPST